MKDSLAKRWGRSEPKTGCFESEGRGYGSQSSCSSGEAADRSKFGEARREGRGAAFLRELGELYLFLYEGGPLDEMPLHVKVFLVKVKPHVGRYFDHFDGAG